MTAIVGYTFLKAAYSLMITYFGIHAFFSYPSLEIETKFRGPKGPPQDRGGIMSLKTDYIPTYNDWPNVINPELQFWNRKMNKNR